MASMQRNPLIIVGYLLQRSRCKWDPVTVVYAVVVWLMRKPAVRKTRVKTPESELELLYLLHDISKR